MRLFLPTLVLLSFLTPGLASADDRAEFLSRLRESKLEGKTVGCIPGTAHLPESVWYSNAGAKDIETLRLLAAGLVMVEPLFSYTEDGAHERAVGSVFKYKATPLAQKLLKSESGLCLGIRRISRIVSFTTPADQDGLRVTQVTYEYRIEGVPSAQELSQIAVVYPQLLTLTGPLEDQAKFFSTSEGWKLSETTFSVRDVGN